MRLITPQYLLPFLTYIQIFSTFLIGMSVFRGGFIVMGLLVSSSGFFLSNIIKERLKGVQERIVDICILIAFLWMGYNIFKSSFFFEEIIALFIKGALVIEAILSFNSYTRRNLSYMQVLSLFIFICLPLLVNTDSFSYKIYSGVYIFTWLMILRVRINLINKIPNPINLSMWILLFLILAVSLAIASVLKESVSLPKVKYPEPILETKKFDIEEELYQVQDALYRKFMSFHPESLKEKSELIQFLTSLFKHSPYVLEIERARLGLIDFLKRPGLGIEKKEKNIVILLLSKYINLKVRVQNRNLRRDVLQELRRINAPVSTKAKFLVGIVKLQHQDTVKKVNDIVNFLQQGVKESSLNEEIKKKLKEKIKELKDWKIYELYLRGRGRLEKKIENISRRYKNLKTLTSQLFKSIEKAETFPEVSKLKQELDERKEILENIPFDEEREIEKKLKEMLMAKASFMSEMPPQEKIEKREKVITRENKIIALFLKPRSLSLALGEKGRFTVTALYADNSEEEVTSLVEWEISPPGIINVAEGKITPLRIGETAVTAFVGDVKSNSSSVKVGAPRIVALGVEPGQQRIKRGKVFSLKATAFYTDKSKKDVTNLVKWYIEDERIVNKKNGGQFTAQHSGYTRINAFYGKIKSPPVQVRVFVPLIEIIRKAFIILLAVIIAVSILIYIIIKIRAGKLRKLLNTSPSEFIIEAYNNAKKVFAALGIPQRASTPYLEYARYIEEKLPVERGVFLKLTYKFFEASYSSHILNTTDAEIFARDYNKCMNDLKKKYLVSFKFLFIFLGGYPLTV